MQVQDLRKKPREEVEEMLKAVERPSEIMNDITQIQTRFNEMSKKIVKSIVEAHGIVT